MEKLNLFYKQSGQGPAVVVLHGLFGQLDNWAGIAKALESNYTVYLVDQRNHGRSPHSNVFNYDAMAEDLLSLPVKEFALIGHSMGGKTAMFFAKKFPEYVKKLIVVDIGIKHYPVHHREIIDALKKLDVSQLNSRNDADLMLSEDIKEFGVRQFLLKNLYRKEDNSFGWRFNLDAIDREIESVGETVKGDPSETESYFINGEKSKYVLESDRPDILKHFPKAKFITIPNAGHWVHAEQPELLIDVFNEILK